MAGIWREETSCEARRSHGHARTDLPPSGDAFRVSAMARCAAHIAIHNCQMLATMQSISHGVWPYRCVCVGFGKIPVPHFKPSAATAKAYSCAMDSPKPSAHRGAARKTPVAMAKLEQTCPTSEEMRSSPYNIHNDAKHKLSVTLLPFKNAPRIASPFRAHFPVLLFDVLECHIASLLRTNAMCDINRTLCNSHICGLMCSKVWSRSTC